MHCQVMDIYLHMKIFTLNSVFSIYLLKRNPSYLLDMEEHVVILLPCWVRFMRLKVKSILRDIPAQRKYNNSDCALNLPMYV